MAEYLYGTYGHLAESVVKAAAEAPTAALYVGTAPVNLIQGGTGLVNKPIRLDNFTDAVSKIGYASNWAKYTLCEAMAAHFQNAGGNVGPIYVINVLDPDVNRKGTATTKSLTFVNGKASFASEDVILDTITLAGKTTDDFVVSYNYTTGKVTILSANESSPLTGTIVVSYYEVDASDIDEGTVIGSTSGAGVRTGLEAADLIYQETGAIVSLFAAPGWSEKPAVYRALVNKATKLNGHWDGFVFADIPVAYDTVEFNTVDAPSGDPKEKGYYEKDGDEYVLTDDTTVDAEKTYYTRDIVTTTVDTIAKAKAWKTANGYTSERSKVFWPMAHGTDGNNYHLSSLAMAETMKLDIEHDGVPMETCGNTSIPVDRQYFGAVDNQGYDVNSANELTEQGIDTLAYWGGSWKLWGDHTAAYSFANTDLDPRDIFDVSMRMLFYITNRFQVTWAPYIDEPFTVALKDTILIREQERLDALVVAGALIGSPKISFEPGHNSLNQVRNGQFRWDIAVTPTPPFKAASAYVAYTDEGFDAYFA